MILTIIGIFIEDSSVRTLNFRDPGLDWNVLPGMAFFYRSIGTVTANRVKKESILQVRSAMDGGFHDDRGLLSLVRIDSSAGWLMLAICSVVFTVSVWFSHCLGDTA